MGIGDRSAFPEDLDEQHEVDASFKDDDETGWLGKIRKKTKHWNAFGNRSPKGIAFGCFPPPLVLLYAVLLPFALWFWLDWRWWMLVPFCPIPLARKWRECPTVIFAVKGKGYWRIESLDGHEAPINFPDQKFLFFPRLETSAASVMTKFYLSRVQLWCRWHFALQWPGFYSWHYVPNEKDVIPVGKREDRDGKIWNHYFGSKFDAQRIYWLWAWFFGRNYK